MVFQTQILMPISEEYTPLGKCNRAILAKNTKKQTSTLNFLINLKDFGHIPHQINVFCRKTSLEIAPDFI